MVLPGLSIISFVVTRPIIIPVVVFSGGLVYGSYDISKRSGCFLFRRKTTQNTFTSYGIGTFTGIGVVSVRNFLSPYKKETEVMMKELSFQSLRTAQKLVQYHISTIAIAGVVAGLSAAYSISHENDKDK